jgi:hypothetical protein
MLINWKEMEFVSLTPSASHRNTRRGGYEPKKNAAPLPVTMRPSPKPKPDLRVVKADGAE